MSKADLGLLDRLHFFRRSALKISAHQCKSAAEKGFALRSYVVRLRVAFPLSGPFGPRGSVVAALLVAAISPLMFASEQTDFGNEHQVHLGIFWSIRKPFSINDLEAARFGIKSAF